jgi:hypothetical protein
VSRKDWWKENSSTEKEKGISNSNALARGARDFFPFSTKFPPISQFLFVSLTAEEGWSKQKRKGEVQTKENRVRQHWSSQHLSSE